MSSTQAIIGGELRESRDRCQFFNLHRGIEMEFKKAFEVQKKSGGGRTSTDSKAVTVSLSKAGEGRHQLTIAIGEGTMKSMRWIAGDRVAVNCGSVDGKLAVMLNRCESGFTLSSTKGPALKGKFTRSALKVNYSKELEMHFRGFVGKSFVPTVSEESLIFTL